MFSPTGKLSEDKQSHAPLKEELPYRFRRMADTTPGNWEGYERGLLPRKVGSVAPGIDGGCPPAVGPVTRIADRLPTSRITGRVGNVGTYDPQPGNTRATDLPNLSSAHLVTILEIMLDRSQLG